MTFCASLLIAYLPSFFLGGAGDASLVSLATDATTGVGAWTVGAEATTGDACTTAAGAGACTTAAGAGATGAGTTSGVFDRLRSRSSMTSAGGFSIVSWIFFKMLSNESWPKPKIEIKPYVKVWDESLELT